MKITKLFKILCLFPILAGCNQTPVAEKEQLIIPTYYFDDSNPMPEEYRPQVEKMKIYERKKPRYDVTPNELRAYSLCMPQKNMNILMSYFTKVNFIPSVFRQRQVLLLLHITRVMARS